MTAPIPGTPAFSRREEMLAEIQRLRAAGHESTLTPVERKRRDRRLMVIPLYASGMVTSEVAKALGLTKSRISGWSARDPEISWWCQAAYAARCDVWSEGLTKQDRERGHNQRRRARLFARTAANGGVAPVEVHGRASVYVNWNCRCTPCSEANSAALRARRLRRKAIAT